MSLGTEQLTRERQGSGAAADAGRTEPTLGAETVPLCDAGERELERRREERVRLVVAGSGRRRRPGPRTVAIVLAAVLACIGGLVALTASSAPHRVEAGPTVHAPHPTTAATDHTQEREARRRGARHHAETGARREAARRRRLLARRHARANARAAKARSTAPRREAAHPQSAADSDEATAAPEEVTTTEQVPATTTEEAAPVAEEPAAPVAPEPDTSEPSTSLGEEAQAQKEFGFER